MAAITSTEWRSRLRSIFAETATAIDGGPVQRNGGGEFRNILQVKDGVLYAWSEREQCVIALQLAELRRREASALTAAAAADDGDAATTTTTACFQNLVPSTPPIYEILYLVCNPSGQRLALVGKSGINIVELPRRKRPATSDAASNRHICSSTELAERFFLCNPNCHVLQAKWHPGSDTSTHLMVLFSNNYLRVYDSRSPATPVQSCQLGQVPVFRLSPSARNSFGSVLGDTAVDFDFGRSVRVGDHFQDRRSMTLASAIDPDDLVWPVYVLRGNGDVYTTWATNPRNSDLKSEVRGPMTMHPPAEDNYGVDACSIVCLMSSIPVLAIATCSGMLYHCVLLENGPEDGRNSDNHNSLLLDASWRSSGSVHTLAAPDCSLYVYESMELELVLTSAQLDATIDSYSVCPVKLYTDPTTNLRYHCSHATGVHTVALPLVPQLEQYANQTGGEDMAVVLSSIENQNCIIEHLVCTKPLANSPTTPVIGLAVAYGHQLGGTTLLCLTSPFELLTLPLVPTYLDSLPRLLVDDEGGSGETGARVIDRVSKEPFDQHIRRFLQRHTTNPLMKSHSSVDPTPREYVQILSRATKILREEYIEKLDLAKSEIQRRAKILDELKTQQMAELKILDTTKDAISERAENLAEKYEDLQEKQDAFIKRTERVIRALLKRSPVMSDAERSMQREIHAMQEKTKHFKTSIDQIKAKHRYQSGIIERKLANDKRKSVLFTSETQIKQLKELMTKENEMLTSLTCKMNDLQQRLGM